MVKWFGLIAQIYLYWLVSHSSFEPIFFSATSSNLLYLLLKLDYRQDSLLWMKLLNSFSPWAWVWVLWMNFISLVCLRFKTWFEFEYMAINIENITQFPWSCMPKVNLIENMFYLLFFEFALNVKMPETDK